MTAAPFIIVQDSREQLPLDFGSWPVVVNGLRSGDYSIAGLEDRVAIERKSLGDLFGCIGRERDRFERELERLAEMDYACVVVEGNLEDVLAGVERSLVTPQAAAGSLVAWSVKWGLPIWFAGDRRLAAALVLKSLSKFWKYRVAQPGKLRGRSLV